MGKRKGFTLVELLAVIVILAIILIIVVPGVLGIINQTKENALDRQFDMIKEASRLYVTSDSDVTWVGEETKMTTVTLDTLKDKGYLDQKIMDPRDKKEITCAKTVITKTGSKYDYDVTICDQVNASPRLSSNMIPIVYKDNKWVKADYTNKDNNWYDYENQQWANMATVTESTRDAYKKADIGTEVKMEDINAMFVWVPRFKYKLFNADGTVSPVGNPNMAGDYLIDVQLEDAGTPKSKGSQNGQWLTHPAFTFGGEELSGFWVGKFDTGYLDASSKTEAEKNIIDVSKVVVKPNVYGWRGISLAKMFYMTIDLSQSKSTFGLTKIEDSHMMKNIEWGAMTYLSYSNYGKSGNVIYNGNETKILINNNADYLTGCGADSQNAEPTSTCNSYETIQGQASSTTGNISGVYDTAGGSYDYVAGVIKSVDGNFNQTTSEFTEEQLQNLEREGKYLDIYDTPNKANDYQIGKLGDATKEMGPFLSSTYLLNSWSGRARLPYSTNSWFGRGGDNRYKDTASPSTFWGYQGDPWYAPSWRIIII